MLTIVLAKDDALVGHLRGSGTSTVRVNTVGTLQTLLGAGSTHPAVLVFVDFGFVGDPNPNEVGVGLEVVDQTVKVAVAALAKATRFRRTAFAVRSPEEIVNTCQGPSHSHRHIWIPARTDDRQTLQILRDVISQFDDAGRVDLGVGVNFDTEARSIHSLDEAITLTRTESRLLELIHRAGGQPVARSTLMCDVWGPDWTSSANLLDTHLSNLKSKLRRIEPSLEIRNKRGVGVYLPIRDKSAVG